MFREEYCVKRKLEMTVIDQLRDDLARNQRQEKWNRSSSQKDGKSCSMSQGQGLKSIPVNLFSMFEWIIQLHPGFCLGSSSISPSWDCPLLCECETQCHVRGSLRREHVTLTTGARPCLEPGQCGPSSSLQVLYKATQTPILAFIDRAWTRLLHSQAACCWEVSCLQKRHKRAFFSKTFSISGGRRSIAAGTTAALG